MPSHILGDDDSDDDFGVFQQPAHQTPSRQQPIQPDDPFSPISYEQARPSASLIGSSYTSHAQDEESSYGGYGPSSRMSRTSGGYRDEQSQNPATYGGGSASNPLGTMQDVGQVRRFSMQDGAYDTHYEDGQAGRHVRNVSGRSNLSMSKRRPGLDSLDSMEGDLPLAISGAPMAGVESRTEGAAGGQMMGGWSLDDDDDEMMGGTTGGHRGAAPPLKRQRRGLKDVATGWVQDLRDSFSGKPKELKGERTVYVYDADRSQRESRFATNYVSTTKYNPVTFLPKFLFEQFSKYANLFFLFTACIQQIPNVSPTNRWTTIAPLSLVLLVAAFKEVSEDLKRRSSDAELNARRASVLSPDRQFASIPWRSVRVGDIVRLESNDFFPADLVLLSSSEPEGLAYIETSNLDGETNLKIKQAHPSTAPRVSPETIATLHGSHLRSEQPNNSLYTYEGTLVMRREGGLAEKDVPMSPEQMMLRGAQLRNTAWMYGLVVFTGHETKLMRNATAAPIKRTAVEKMVNVQIVFLFIILLVLSVGSSIGSFIRTFTFGNDLWYLFLADAGNRVKLFVEDILTFIILYNNLIPISLIVTMEMVKFQQALLINSDLDMYYAPSDTPALCRTSSLVEELGQIEYVFSDKTGTLTQNHMEFRQLSVAGVPYADVVDENKKGEVFSFADLGRARANGDEASRVIQEFLTLLAACHTVIPEEKDGKITYQASSPDEAALVQGAEALEYRFRIRKPQSIVVEEDGVPREYQILNILEFNSTRKRMSAIIRTPTGQIKLYCKGADTVILERCSENQPYKEVTLNHLEDYATEGLRTLCIAMREISEEEYRPWASVYEKAAATINGRGEAIDKAAELIEKNLFLLGATAIEDKLQDGVPDTIYTLQQAGIRVWVLTGDRQETAINIGLSCRLISESMSLVVINEETAAATSEFIEKRLLAIRSQKSQGDIEDLALVIDGKSLGFALDKSVSKSFLDLAILCKAVVCCRVSPLQKALVVKLVKKNIKNSITLAIGDGANDVSMIQAAHIGVGISGVEGLQAARSADVAISQFRFLKKLLLVHGTWSYQRLSKLILYSFYKNIALYLTAFYYAFFNGFSGQILVESWTLTFYNVLFSVLPPFVIGVFDQFVSARMLDRYPELYTLGQRNAFFTVKIFWEWVANAVYHSLLIFVFAVLIFHDDVILAHGYIGGHWVLGTTVYMVMLLTVLGKAALISDLWTKWTLLAIPGSFIVTMIFMPLYALIAPLINVSREYQGIVPRLWGSSVFWFSLLGLPVLCLLRDFAWKAYKRMYRPESYHIVQEIQKFNLPDYRPRMEQFQKAIKKVRAVQRMRRNRGFAFSQTEERQEQLIRSYDTTLAKAKG